MNGFKCVYYSNLYLYDREVYINKIYNFLFELNFKYHDFKKWYAKLFSKQYFLKQERKIIFFTYKANIVSLAILKKSYKENKICTFKVNKKFQKIYLGKKLMELSFNWLEDDKPLITINRSEQIQFNRLFNYYGFQLEQEKIKFYNSYDDELVYNNII